MSSGEDYLKTVVDMVDDLVAGLNEQAAEALAAHNEQQAFCAKQIPAYKKQIAEANRQAQVCDATVASTKELLADTEKMLATTLQELADINARILAGQNQRDAEHAAWSALNEQHESGVSACAQAVALINSLKRGALFIQLQGRINAVAKRLEDMTHLNDKFTAYAPLINSFAQIASSSGNQQLLDQITKLLNTLKGQISETQAADASWESRKAAQWQKELTDLTAQRDALVARRNAQQAQISSQKKIIKENEEAAASARDEAMRTTILLEDQVKQCNEEQRSYTAAKAARYATSSPFSPF